MKLRVEIDSNPFSVVLNSLNIQKQLAGRSSTCSFDLAVFSTNGYENVFYDTETYDDSSFSSGNVPQQFSEVIVYNDNTEDKIFRGFITSVGRQQKNNRLQFWSVSCVGLEFLLENITINRTWSGKSDREILQDAFGDVLPEVTTDDATVAELAVAIDFEAKDLTLRELVEQLSQISGAEWRVTEDKELSYRASGSVEAPFGFSATPDDSHSPPLKKWIITSRERHSEQFANKVTILGAFTGTDGAELRSTTQNDDNIAELGRIIEAIVVARDIDNQPALDLAASIELEKRAVQETLTFDFFEDGLEVGMLVQIYSPPVGVDSAYVINTLTLKQTSPDRTRYTASVGDYRGTLAERLRELDRIKTGPKLVVIPPPGPNSIGENQLQDSSVTTLKIAEAAVDEARIAVAAITNSLLAAGAVTNTKIADNAISTPKIIAGAVTSASLAANSVVAGKIAAGTITGAEIQAGSITASNAVFATGAIVNANIANATIQGAKIANATITSTQIASATITAANIANATITNTQIANATITAAKIVSIDASTITTGSLSASFISGGTLAVGSGGITVSGNISGALLDNASVGDVKIAAGLSATKITTGTLDASFVNVINLNASHITTGTLNASLITGGTITGVAIDAPTVTAGTVDAFFSVNVSGYFSRGGTQVVGARQAGPGTPSFSSFSNVQTWCAALLTALQTHGLVT